MLSSTSRDDVLWNHRTCCRRGGGARADERLTAARAHSSATAAACGGVAFFPVDRVIGRGAHFGAGPARSHSALPSDPPPASTPFKDAACVTVCAIARCPPPICGALVCTCAGRTVVAEPPILAIGSTTRRSRPSSTRVARGRSRGGPPEWGRCQRNAKGMPKE